MPLSPVCLIKEGSGSYIGTTNGVDITPNSTVSIKLNDTFGATGWYLEIIGTDELSVPAPTLTGVGVGNLVTSPSTVVTFTFPNGVGRALGFKSRVEGAGGPIETTFGLYSLTSFNTRVGFVTETRESDINFGWAKKVNEMLRTPSGSGGAENFSYKTVADSVSVTIPEFQEMLISEDVTVEGDLVVDGDVTVIDFSGTIAGPPGPAVVDYPGNKNMQALLTTSDGDLACHLGLDATPHASGALTVSVNGLDITNIGNGSKVGVTGYWSNDLGLTAKARANVTAGDKFYWNGSIAGYELSPTDIIDFWFNIAL